MSELALELIEKEKREKTGSLYLRNCELVNPEELSELSWLNDLDLSSKNISDISFLEKLISLKTLFLYNNQISDIRHLEKLNELNTLYLFANIINDISFIEKLTNLKFLDLSHNRISDISFLGTLTTLQTLNIDNNPIIDHTILGKLTSLQTLGLSLNKISDYSFLEKLNSLTSLNLSYNNIRDFSFLERLTSLTNLGLSYNKISDYNFLEKLTSLTSLDLKHNQISDISFLEKLTSLTSLDLSHNQISDFSFLEKLTSLVSLNLSDNQINDFSFLEKLTSLTSLDLSDNKISDIYGLIPLLKMGASITVKDSFDNGIWLYENPITNPPMNIVEQGGDAVLGWFEQIGEFGAEPFYESKLMILGQGGAGKTTFANLLLDPNYEVIPGKLDSTLGIVVHRGKEFEHNGEDNPKIKAHLWDFGGQDIQKMLHQFFITENCLYVLVSDKRAENTNFDYWFQIINMLGPKSSIIVLENPKESKGANESFAIQKYCELYPELVIESIEVNLNEARTKHRTKWKLLNEMITDKMSEMEIVNRLVPKKWGMVRNKLEKLKEQKYISKDVFYALCSNPEIGLNHRQADWCLAYFRSLGDLVYFDDRDLCTHIFLDHNWLTKGMYFILSDKKIQEDGGRFTRAQAYKQWNANDYNEVEKAMLLQLLLKDKFDICYELPDQKDVFISSLLLPVDKPAKWEFETNLRFRYQYGFIPHGLFSRLIVQLHEKIDSEQHWKTGVRLIDTIVGKPVSAEVQQYNDPEENQLVIDIKINGDKNGCKQMLAFIRNAIEKLHKDFRNISVKRIVACNCKTCAERMKQGDKPSFFEYEMLQEKVLNRNYFADCKESKWKPVNIGQIINDVVIENAGKDNQDNYLLNKLKEMGMSINQIINNNNNQATATSTSKADASATNTITISIQTILGEIESLKEDFEDERKLLQKDMNDDEIDVTIRDIEKAETAVKELEAAQKRNQELPAKSKNRLKRFIDDLSDEESTLHKGLKLLRKGKDYGVNLAELYNKVAANTGMPLIPSLALEVIKKL